MTAIEVKNLSFSYDGKTPVVDGVNLTINKGEYVSIVGHNGSGKSTLAKLLMGLLAPSGGNIFINEQPLNNKTVSALRSKMALVFQNPDNQFIGVTVEDDIAFGLENRLVPTKEMPKIIREFATKVGMIDYLKNEPSNLSGGQKQRVAIAGALALSPEIIIFDEAASMLDPRGKKEISELILTIKEKQPDLTIISITHDMEEAYTSDRVIAFNKGKIAFDGKPEEMLIHQEELNKLHLAVPFVLEMKNKLKDIGIETKGNNMDSLLEAICPSK